MVESLFTVAYIAAGCLTAALGDCNKLDFPNAAKEGSMVVLKVETRLPWLEYAWAPPKLLSGTRTGPSSLKQLLSAPHLSEYREQELVSIRCLLVPSTALGMMANKGTARCLAQTHGLLFTGWPTWGACRTLVFRRHRPQWLATAPTWIARIGNQTILVEPGGA